MNDKAKIILKNKLFEASRLFVAEKIENLEISMRAARESGNDETKSTTGDKHETGKAMMQLEQEKIGIQLNELQKMSKVLEGIPQGFSPGKIKPGNVVVTNQGNFYISVAAGKISMGKELYFAISAVSPLGNLFLKSSSGESVNFNGKVYGIIESY
ncbi:MAG: 3-oxoacyl-ACP synthase [Bacteroidetes bacterium]|jgi:transcription elongation GreA/GreB family factor|nr:3-oxoacyl-ACP synthase [Bacteroidota bacterium]